MAGMAKLQLIIIIIIKTKVYIITINLLCKIFKIEIPINFKGGVSFALWANLNY